MVNVQRIRTLSPQHGIYITHLSPKAHGVGSERLEEPGAMDEYIGKCFLDTRKLPI